MTTNNNCDNKSLISAFRLNGYDFIFPKHQEFEVEKNEVLTDNQARRIHGLIEAKHITSNWPCFSDCKNATSQIIDILQSQGIPRTGDPMYQLWLNLVKEIYKPISAYVNTKLNDASSVTEEGEKYLNLIMFRSGNNKYFIL